MSVNTNRWKFLDADFRLNEFRFQLEAQLPCLYFEIAVTDIADAETWQTEDDRSPLEKTVATAGTVAAINLLQCHLPVTFLINQ